MKHRQALTNIWIHKNFIIFICLKGFCLEVTSSNQVIAVQERNKQPGKSLKCKWHMFFLVHIFHLTVSNPLKNCFTKIAGLLRAKFDRSVVLTITREKQQQSVLHKGVYNEGKGFGSLKSRQHVLGNKASCLFVCKEYNC